MSEHSVIRPVEPAETREVRRLACMRIDTADAVHWPDDRPGDAVYIHKVAVARRAAGRGWTARLIHFAADLAAGLGIRFLRLDTLPREKLIGLYRGLGFRLVDEGPRLFAGRELVRMERALGGNAGAGSLGCPDVRNG